MNEPTTQAESRLLDALRAYRPMHAEVREGFLGLIAELKAEARALEHDRLAHVAWAKPAIEREALPPVFADVARCLGIAYEQWRETHKRADGSFRFEGMDGPFDLAVAESVRRLRLALAETPEAAT